MREPRTERPEPALTSSVALLLPTPASPGPRARLSAGTERAAGAEVTRRALAAGGSAVTPHSAAVTRPAEERWPPPFFAFDT